MGQLDRYKKPGGFAQLLALIESFGVTKQQKFLSIVEEENPTWGNVLKEKLLTVERIMGWPPNVIAEIVPKINVNILSIALHGMNKENVEKFMSGLPAGEKRKITAEYEVARPQPADIATTHIKMIEAVRRMINDGELRLEVIDPSALINEKTEEQLLQASNSLRSSKDDQELVSEVGRDMDRTGDLVKEALKEVSQTKTGDSAKANQEIKTLQSLVMTLQKENKTLKTEVKVLKDKLESIRKIA